LIYVFYYYNKTMAAEAKEKPIVKPLNCGGHGIFTTDPKSKQLMQTGYIGANLDLKGFLPPDAVIQK